MGNVYKTNDSGVNWSLQGQCILTDDGVGLSFVNNSTGYFGDEDGNIYETSDSGINWILQGQCPITNEGQIYFLKNLTTSITQINHTINPRSSKLINFQGQEIQSQNSQPFIKIYDDGSIEKKLVIE